VTIAFSSDADAGAFVAWFGAPFRRAAAEAEISSADARVDQHGKQVSIQIPALGVLQAMSFSMFLRRTVVEAFKIPSSSMEPTLPAGDHVFVAKGARAGKAERGDVVVFHKDGKDFVKRVVAVAGDRVAFDGEKLLINDKETPRARAADYRYLAAGDGSTTMTTATRWRESLGKHRYEVLGGRSGGSPMAPLIVPPGSVFVLGDNRGNSHDSRFFGPVPLSDVVGPVVFTWFSSTEVGDVRWERVGQTVE
jgi:signal peptidase I